MSKMFDEPAQHRRVPTHQQVAGAILLWTAVMVITVCLGCIAITAIRWVM